MKKIEILVLIIYTAITLKFLWPFISTEDATLGLALRGGTSNFLLALFVGAFLNAALIIYWLNKKQSGSGF